MLGLQVKAKMKLVEIISYRQYLLSISHCKWSKNLLHLQKLQLYYFRGFIVFGDYDPATGISKPETSFEGKLSQLALYDVFITTEEIDNLYKRSVTNGYIQF